MVFPYCGDHSKRKQDGRVGEKGIKYLPYPISYPIGREPFYVLTGLHEDPKDNQRVYGDTLYKVDFKNRPYR